MNEYAALIMIIILYKNMSTGQEYCISICTVHQGVIMNQYIKAR